MSVSRAVRAIESFLMIARSATPVPPTGHTQRWVPYPTAVAAWPAGRLPALIRVSHDEVARADGHARCAAGDVLGVGALMGVIAGGQGLLNPAKGSSAVVVSRGMPRRRPVPLHAVRTL